MSEETDSTPGGEVRKDVPRTFLCVVDDTPEFEKALRFACRRASHSGGRIALVYVMPPAEFQHWVAVGERMREEAREEAEEMLNVVSATVHQLTGKTPIVFIREGQVREEILNVLEEQTDVSLLVLGAATGPEGPGPLVEYLVEKMAGKLTVPVTIVPGNMDNAHIDEIT